MRHDHLKRELDLLLMLTQNRAVDTQRICEELGISRRSLYYYLEFFQLAGFKVEKHGRYYSIDRSSRFFRKLFDIIQFTEEEALLMRQLINSAENTPRLKSLHDKLDKFYDFKILEDEVLHRRSTEIRNNLYNAVKFKQKVKIIGYSSPNSHSVKDRLVEPFLFLNNNRDVRCYEESSGINKTFRISRMKDVVVLDDNWEHEYLHREAFTDLFQFSGERIMHITLLMGQLAHNVMLEEYPHSASCFTQQEDGSWNFQCDVCSYLGIGRFVLGLYDDITIVEDEGFRKYISDKIAAWNAKDTTKNPVQKNS